MSMLVRCPAKRAASTCHAAVHTRIRRCIGKRCRRHLTTLHSDGHGQGLRTVTPSAAGAQPLCGDNTPPLLTHLARTSGQLQSPKSAPKQPLPIGRHRKLRSGGRCSGRRRWQRRCRRRVTRPVAPRSRSGVRQRRSSSRRGRAHAAGDLPGPSSIRSSS
jgi:hypothetical protein